MRFVEGKVYKYENRNKLIYLRVITKVPFGKKIRKNGALVVEKVYFIGDKIGYMLDELADAEYTDWTKQDGCKWFNWIDKFKNYGKST